jgi:hypothetical protein
MTPSASNAGGGRRVTRWTRELIIEKIREWNDRYGEPPCSADWNPSLARWRAQEWRAERYREGVWPSTNASKRPFDGSFDAAVRAAGLEPHRPGPRRRLPGEARPTVAQRGPVAPRVLADELLAADERARLAEAHAAALERRLAAAERRAERAEDKASDARRRARRASEQAGRARRAGERTRSTARETRELSLERVELLAVEAEARVRASEDQAEAAAHDAYEARRAARSAETRAVDAEARAGAAERLVAAAQAELSSAGTSAAWAATREAEARAAEAERRARELASLVCGEQRRLTAGELRELRDGGPSGPAVLASALKALGRARATGDRTGLAAALGQLASAAVRWRDRL